MVCPHSEAPALHTRGGFYCDEQLTETAHADRTQDTRSHKDLWGWGGAEAALCGDIKASLLGKSLRQRP